jgi:hypothetical protein
VDLIEPKVVDVGLSDDHALSWSSIVKTGQSTVSSGALNVRPWRRLDMESFRAALMTSRLCAPMSWPDDIDDLCALYITDLTMILDQLIPLCRPPIRRRPSDPWYDADCQAAKIASRKCERDYAAACRRAKSTSSALPIPDHSAANIESL